MSGFSSKKHKKNAPKTFKVDEDKIKSRPKIKTDTVAEDLTKEVIDIPVYCSSPIKDRDIDLFLVHAMIQSNREAIKPYFVGNYSYKSFDMEIKSSSMALEPKDLVKNDSDSVMNLSRR